MLELIMLVSWPNSKTFWPLVTADNARQTCIRERYFEESFVYLFDYTLMCWKTASVQSLRVGTVYFYSCFCDVWRVLLRSLVFAQRMLVLAGCFLHRSRSWLVFGRRAPAGSSLADSDEAVLRRRSGLGCWGRSCDVLLCFTTGLKRGIIIDEATQQTWTFFLLQMKSWIPNPVATLMPLMPLGYFSLCVGGEQLFLQLL